MYKQNKALRSDSETMERWLQGTTRVWKLTLLSTVNQSQDSGGLDGVYAIPQESGNMKNLGILSPHGLRKSVLGM